LFAEKREAGERGSERTQNHLKSKAGIITRFGRSKKVSNAGENFSVDQERDKTGAAQTALVDDVKIWQDNGPCVVKVSKGRKKKQFWEKRAPRSHG